MRAHLGWNVVIATVIEQAVRGGFTMGEADGVNLGIFGLIAVAVHYSLKGGILRTDPESFAWRHKSPWHLVFWTPALLFMAVSWSRFW